MSTLFVRCICVIVFVTLVIAPTRAADQIGGRWHDEAMLAWKKFNNGKDLPEGDLKVMLLNGTNEDRERYYSLACEAGSGVFCTNAGIFTRDKHKAAKFYVRGCEIIQETVACVSAVDALLSVGNSGEAKTIFKRACNADNPFCDMGDPRVARNQKYKKVLLELCKEGHAVSCSLLTKYGVKHTEPTSASTEAAKIVEARHASDRLAKSWDGQYENADCRSLTECKDASEQISKSATILNYPEKHLESMPYSAKACSYGSAADCLGVGQYEEDRKDEAAAYTWFKRGCDFAPEAHLICLAAVDAKLKLQDISVATALFLKTCSDDQDGFCESQILGGCKKGDCFGSKTIGKQYLEMLSKACRSDGKVSCRISARLKAALN